MKNIFQKCDYNFTERFARGRKFEQIIDEVLIAQGRNIKPVTKNQDIHEKIDRIETLADGTQHNLAYKARTTGLDILLDLYEPFYGIDNTKTHPGRDLVSPYHKYFCLERGGGKLREILGEAQKLKVKIVLNEWAECKYYLDLKQWFRSATIPGISMKYHTDASTYKPKIIMFISPKVYKDNEEIWCYEIK